MIETFIRGLLKGSNVTVGFPILIMNLVAIMFVPFILEYAFASARNALLVLRCLIIWINVQYILIAYYNSLQGHSCRPRRHRSRTMRIDILIPQQTDMAVDDIEDEENVHDSGVQNSVAEAIRNLKEKTPLVISREDTIKELKDYIFNTYKGSVLTKELAYSALRQMEKEDKRIDRLGMKETEVLQLIWNRIQNPLNESARENLCNNLILELAASMKDLNNAQCPTGRVNRVVQSLEIADNENIVLLKTDQIMKEEITLLIGPLRERFLHSLSAEEQRDYQEGEEEPSSILRSLIDKELRSKYVETNLLSEEKYLATVQPLLKEI